MSTGICSTYEQDYCNKTNCGRGDGDCNLGNCGDGYVCGNTTFLAYHSGLKNCSITNAVNDAKVCIDGNENILFIINEFKNQFFGL